MNRTASCCLLRTLTHSHLISTALQSVSRLECRNLIESLYLMHIMQTAYFSAASGKSFLTYEEARQWLDISTASSSAARGCKNYATVSNATESLPTTEVTTQQKYVDNR
ncbi:hypothetical protein BDQ12DRAFT_224739 [Crucibulum laeve]|uniref:Uncharacterized protein n=1 Tax=Crucibulum laeve TaxID=68775 RepID=A0A5C3LVN3_9AGAR|nr:hypothetical protein BDQ12DRAFT_224739 [Crucibulum laeve]